MAKETNQQDPVSAILYESGAGFPSRGDLVFHNATNSIWQLVETGSHIRTNGFGEGNSIHCTVVRYGDPDDLTPDQWESIDMFGCCIRFYN